jgi:uncharacterized membrane protein YjgN (DUF898 family)
MDNNNGRVEPALNNANTTSPAFSTNDAALPPNLPPEPTLATAEALPEQRHPFTFTGKGSEYFGIWIVNIFLSIITLGIYSAWAKVRRLQYFHRHTQVAGSSFDFHGKPIDILKGRLIAFGMYALYAILTRVSMTAALVLALILFLVIPYFVYKSLRFRMHNTSWRQVRFKFFGKVPGAYGAFVGWPLLAMVSFYLLAPVSHHQITNYTMGNSALGTTLAAFKAKIGDFYKVYLKTFGLFLLFMLATGVLTALVIGASSAAFKERLSNIAAQSMEANKDASAEPAKAAEDEEEEDANTSKPDPALGKSMTDLFLITAFLPFVIIGFYLLAFLCIGPYFAARIGNVIWNGTTLGPMRFESTLSARKLSFITITNFLGIMLTLGFYKPFAAVRIAQYRADCLKLVAAGPIATHAQAIAGNVNARGEEIAEMFDVDIGL